MLESGDDALKRGEGKTTFSTASDAMPPRVKLRASFWPSFQNACTAVVSARCTPLTVTWAPLRFTKLGLMERMLAPVRAWEAVLAPVGLEVGVGVAKVAVVGLAVVGLAVVGVDVGVAVVGVDVGMDVVGFAVGAPHWQHSR